MYQSYQRVKIHDADAAGILFFAHYIKIAHDVYEEFMAEIENSLSYIINESPYLLLIVHSEADYKKSLKYGEEFMVELTANKLGKTSFELNYRFINSSEELAAEVKTTHVSVDRDKIKPIALDEDLKKKLDEHTA